MITPSQTKDKAAAYYASHREERLANMHAYYVAHQEEKAAYHKAHYETHREEKAIYAAVYNAAHKEERAAKARAYYTAHRGGLLAQHKVYRDAHREKIAARDVVYGKAHRPEMAEQWRKRSALKRGVTIGPINIEDIKVRDRMRCCICGKRVVEKDLSFDHTIPLSLGGSHSQENQRVAHLRCNIRRGAGRLPVQMVLV